VLLGWPWGGFGWFWEVLDFFLWFQVVLGRSRLFCGGYGIILEHVSGVVLGGSVRFWGCSVGSGVVLGFSGVVLKWFLVVLCCSGVVLFVLGCFWRGSGVVLELF
jgi:hypothetical protein